MDWWWTLRLVVPPLLVIVVFSLVVARRQKLLQRLQERWGWLGAPVRHHGAGREWTGEVDGRRIVVRWFEHNTTIEVAAHPSVEAGFTRPGQPAEIAGVHGTRVELPGKVGYAPDPAVIRELTRDPAVDQALATLLGTPDRSLRAVRVDPHGTVSWFARNLPEKEVTAAEARRWVDALVVVARAAEA